MVTELMLILIVVGAGIIFIVWSNSRKRQRSETDRREVEESTNKFKLELEKTANEIIGRMELQASRLENLLDDSERNRAQLEGRVIELKKLLKRGEGQSTEIRDLLERLDDAVDDVNEMQKQMDEVERKINAAINVQIPAPPVLNSTLQMMPPLVNPLMQNPQVVQQTNSAQPIAGQTVSTPQPAPPAVNPIQSPITPPPILRQSAQPTPPAQVPTPPVEVQEDFSKVLEKTMSQEESKPIAKRPIQSPEQKISEQPEENSAPQIPKRHRAPRPLTSQGSIAERQARVLAERQGRSMEKIVPVEAVEQKPPTPILTERSEKIRKAAVAAIQNAVEQENTIDVEEISPVEELKSNKKIQSLKSKAANLGEKNSEPAKFVDSNPDSANIRDMLLSGMTVEEISRETGLGRGAIELVQQMARRQLERK